MRSPILFFPRTAFVFSLCLSLAGLLGAAEPASVRQTISLNGTWQFQRESAQKTARTNSPAPAPEPWKRVTVPSSFQEHEGTNFHGIGWYRRSIEPLPVPPGKRVLLQFQAAATEAEVWWNGQRLGAHLGGWTPFRFDITELLRQAPAGQKQELRVRLDEKVGHNTQGFLPIIAPHFGGLWQDVSLLIVPETYVEDLQVLAVGAPARQELRVALPLAGTAPEAVTNVSLRWRLRGEAQWQELSPVLTRSGHTLQLRAPTPQARHWSPAAPNLYEVAVTLPGPGADSWRTRAAFRSLEAFGPQLRLNGQPLNVRGLLNWGYSAPLVQPNPGEAVWRQELELARARGFNLMKFCLWVPPQRYLELADELGMLTWMEYPTWHPNLTQKHLAELRREFGEFFLYDRNHPSVVLRSLTCETGPSAELPVLQSLYNTAHDMIPGALVEDDSSWIGWNRVHDFYDDHPYGNNHTWVPTLTGFNDYILAHGLKPLVLGETTSADTWIDREALLQRLGSKRPWWAPNILDDTVRWTERMRAQAGPGGLDQLRADSLRYGMLMRKYQIEAFRREIPFGGYDITVIRDFTTCSMGLIDYLGQPKWTEADWAWHRDTICLLKTEADRRSFSSGAALRAQILLSHFGLQAIREGRLQVTLEPWDGNGASPALGTPLQRQELKAIQQNPGTLAQLLDLNWTAPQVSAPTHLRLRAVLQSPQGEWRNEWPIWVVPATAPEVFGQVQVHRSVAPGLAQELFPGSRPFDANTQTVAVAAHFDPELVRFLEAGGRVLFLPDGQRHSFALNAHWFLRGAPYIPEHRLSRQVPRDLLLELQHFDLAAEVIPNLPHLEAMDPLLLLWDTHDVKAIKTHGVVFETGAAQGRLLVSALRHSGTNNAAGHWLLGVLLEHLRTSAPPRHALGPDVWAYLKDRLQAEQTNLVERTWSFHPDRKDEGLSRGWQLPGLANETDWKPIRIGAYWESQGYADLDGWAWYRLWVEIPERWQGREVFLSFEGVDDMYELYLNGELAGKGGDLATRKDTLGEKKSYPITRLVKPGQKALIAVRVHDWYGAGGIYRPITLGTQAFNPELDLLK
ncbi:MAG TPA: hypothetical protein VNT26_17275 [Candidatus Sulfotelmatobacter sp.]|nr:hypothetical protein [Candidatus Sulfotelmatobacter sp.]